MAGAFRLMVMDAAVAGLDLVFVGMATIFAGAVRVGAAAFFGAGFAVLA